MLELEKNHKCFPNFIYFLSLRKQASCIWQRVVFCVPERWGSAGRASCTWVSLMCETSNRGQWQGGCQRQQRVGKGKARHSAVCRQRLGGLALRLWPCGREGVDPTELLLGKEPLIRQFSLPAGWFCPQSTCR